MLNNIYILLFLLLAWSNSHGQDIHFSQFIYNPLNLNPANTGIFNGDSRVNAAYRQQWNSITVPYRTFSLAYDQALNIPKINGRNSAGIVLNDDRAGDGDYGTFQMLLSYAHLFSLGKDSIHFLSAGLQGGIVYRSVNTDKLTFDNQFNGDVFDPTLSTNEEFDRSHYIYPDFSAGLIWMGVFDEVNTCAGASFQHLLKPEQSFLNEDAPLPSRMQLHASALLKKNSKLSFMPSALYMSQDEFHELSFGIEAIFNSSKGSVRNKAFSLSCHYRTADAIIPAIGIYYNQWRFGLSYDINTSDLDAASNGRGGPEFNVIYILKKIRYTAAKSVCPVY